MMRIVFGLLIFILISPNTSLAAESAEAMALDREALTKNQRLIRLCNTSAVNYVQPDGVEYTPGIDTKGQAVLGADAGVEIHKNDFPIYIPIEMDLIERFNLNVPLGLIADAEVAGIQVYEDGKITYNGHDISSNVSSFCSENHLIQPFTAPPAHNPDSDK